MGDRVTAVYAKGDGAHKPIAVPDLASVNTAATRGSGRGAAGVCQRSRSACAAHWRARAAQGAGVNDYLDYAGLVFVYYADFASDQCKYDARCHVSGVYYW